MIGQLDDRTTRYALAYDGYFTRPGGERLDAIFVEAADRGGTTYTFAQQYKPKRLLRGFQVVRNIALAGKATFDGDGAV
jgi:hypothetical protein